MNSNFIQMLLPLGDFWFWLGVLIWLAGCLVLALRGSPGGMVLMAMAYAPWSRTHILAVPVQIAGLILVWLLIFLRSLDQENFTPERIAYAVAARPRNDIRKNRDVPLGLVLIFTGILILKKEVSRNPGKRA